jgi:hypothetical protein
MSAVLFNLWNPFRTEDGSFTFEITQADTFRVNLGTRQFFDAALDALGIVSGGGYSWAITSGRSLYYSSYPTEQSWRDRWCRTWRVHILPEVALPPRPNTLVQEFVALGESDDTWSEDEDDKERYLHTAFVFADFLKPRDVVGQLASTRLTGAAVRAALLEPAIRDLGNGVSQLQIIVNELDLPADIAALDALAGSFKAEGAVVNWNSHPAWRTEPTEPTTPKVAAWMAEIDRLRKGGG